MADAGGSSETSGYAAQLETLRSVAKWLVAAFGAVGTLLVAGLSVSGIGELPLSSWRLYAAGGSAALALTAVGFMIREASVVLTHEWLTLASFGDEQTGSTLNTRKSDWSAQQLRDIDGELRVSRHELFGYAAESRADLQRRLHRADQRLWRARPGSRREARWRGETEILRQAARNTVQYANYYGTLKLFRRMRARLAWAALIVVISVGVFAYAVNPPTPLHIVKTRSAAKLIAVDPRKPSVLSRRCTRTCHFEAQTAVSPEGEGYDSRHNIRRSPDVVFDPLSRQRELCPALTHSA
jgi:hypothetical protein